MELGMRCAPGVLQPEPRFPGLSPMGRAGAQPPLPALPGIPAPRSLPPSHVGAAAGVENGTLSAGWKELPSPRDWILAVQNRREP